MSLVGAVGSIAVALSIAFAWPQAITARRSADVSGISTTTTVLVLLTAATWLLYGLARHDPAVIVGNGAALSAALVTWSVVRQHLDGASRSAARRLVLAWFASVALAAGAGVTLELGAALIGLLGALLGISMSIPQALDVARTGRTEGVSLTTYLLLFVVMAAWLTYGVLTGDPVIWLTNIVGLVVVGAVLAVLVTRRAGSPAGEPDTGVMFEGAPD